MEAASLCPKCGIELQAEPGSRCPLCGTPLRVNVIAEMGYAPTNPAIPALESSPADVIPVDPANAPTDALPGEDAEATTTSGWSIEAAPPAQPEAPRPAPSSPFTPMPSLVAPPTSLPPPPFAAGIALRPAAAPLPGPPVLGNPQVSDPDSAVTAVMAGPPMPAPRPLIVESASGDEDAVDASSLEITQTAPGVPAPAAPAPRPRASSLPPPPPPPVERGPGRTRGVLIVFVTAAVAGAFYAGRVTAPAAGSFPLPPIATPAETPDLAASPVPTEEAATASPEETSAASEPSGTPSLD